MIVVSGSVVEAGCRVADQGQHASSTVRGVRRTRLRGMDTVTFCATEREIDRVDDVARQRKASRSRLIREAIHLYLSTLTSG